MGMIGLRVFAKKATDVVLEVTAMALTALFQAYDILIFLSPLYTSIQALYLHASIKTKMLSAAIPRTMNITTLCKVE